MTLKKSLSHEICVVTEMRLSDGNLLPTLRVCEIPILILSVCQCCSPLNLEAQE